MEEIAGALVGERQAITGDLGGVLIKTSTLATMEVGLVTISGRAGSTRRRRAGNYLQLRGCQDRQR